MTATVIAGTRPVGSCSPTPENRWAIRYLDDGIHKFVSYIGWLIESETSTDDEVLAGVIAAHIAETVTLKEVTR